MTFTYTPGSTTSGDRVRLLIGDTDVDAPENQRLENEEITDLLTIAGGFRAAAAMACDALAAKFAARATAKRMGQASLEWKRFEHLTAMAERLRAAVSLAAVPFASGYSQSLKDENAADTDLIRPSFTRGMLDNPSTMNSNTTSTAA